MKKKDYQSLLKDPRWQRKRLEIMQRDNFTCQHFGNAKETLNVHHKYYKENYNPWDYEDDCYITLCEKCHNVESEERKLLYSKYIEFRDTFYIKGFSNQVISDIFGNFINYLESIDYNFPLGENMIIDSVCGIQNISDVNALKNIGISQKEINHMLRKINPKIYK